MMIKCLEGNDFMKRDITCYIGNSFLISSDGKDKVYFLGAEGLNSEQWDISLLFEKRLDISLLIENTTSNVQHQFSYHQSHFPIAEGERAPFSKHLGNEFEITECGFFFSNRVKKFLSIKAVVFNKISPFDLQLTCHYESESETLNKDSIMISAHVC